MRTLSVYKIFSLLVLMGASAMAFSQNVPPTEQSGIKPDEGIRYVYKKEWSAGGTISNRGFSAIVRYAIIPQNFFKIQFETEIANLKHPKEYKTSNPYFNNSKLYVYGKQNSFYNIRTGVGTNVLIFDRAPKEGVEISATFMGGVSWGLLKPIYLEIIKDSGNPFNPDIVSEKFDKFQHNETNILGYSGFTKGFNELSLNTGLYIKSGLNFDWSAKDDRITNLEVGAVVDQFFKPVQIMADFQNLKNKSTFISLYATLTFGKKY
jgi:hypothetical protein